jgi:hypothetical protein
MVNYSAYWQAQQKKQPNPQKVLKQAKNGAPKETAKSTHGGRINSVTALA